MSGDSRAAATSHPPRAQVSASAGAQVSYPPGSAVHLSVRPLSGGRLGTYTALGAAAASVPLPFLPELLARRVRGALVHDIAARHGLSLTAEARVLLVDGEPPAKKPILRRAASGAARYATRFALGRFGPLALVPPLRGALATFALGHLFQRYADGLRRERTVRIDEREARKVRRAIEQAYLRSITDDPAGSSLFAPRAPEELRDGVTRVTDGVLMTVASLPEWLTARLESAFDDALVAMVDPPRGGGGGARES
jgi:hypothetical protein